MEAVKERRGEGEEREEGRGEERGGERAEEREAGDERNSYYFIFHIFFNHSIYLFIY